MIKFCHVRLLRNSLKLKDCKTEVLLDKFVKALYCINIGTKIILNLILKRITLKILKNVMVNTGCMRKFLEALYLHNH